MKRPASGWDVVGHHGVWAALSGAALAAILWLPATSWPPIPCWFRALLHRPCPFCGLTRSVQAAGQGHWSESWLGAPLGTILFVALCVFFLWHAIGVATRCILAGPWTSAAMGRKAMLVLTLAVLANWLYRWVLGFDRY